MKIGEWVEFRKDVAVDIRSRLFEMADVEFANFHAKLIPNIERDRVIGVKVPLVRKFAKELMKQPEVVDVFLKELPHYYYEENMLHGLLISEVKDYGRVLELVNEFLPYVDNWAVCDSIIPKVFKKNLDDVYGCILNWVKSEDEYECRFGIKMLMTYFLDDNFQREYLEIPAEIESEKYYINMMIAWYYATALSKQWDDTIKIFENKKLSDWVNNKAIQKARESYRITAEQKSYLQTLKK